MNLAKNDERQALNEIAERNDVSLSAVEHLLQAMTSGHGTLAQFNHPELGGMGQWSKGGMLMVGDMFNDRLKSKVAAICSEVAELVDLDKSDWHAPLARQAQVRDPVNSANQQPRGHWWPEGLGQPSSTGSQNTLRYAFFPESRRLAVADGYSVTLYDTKDHRIGGVSQQQSSGQSLSFTSQHGPIDISQLEKVTKSD
jgi:hypothetical protein